MIIYKVTNKINGMFYIGQTTKKLEVRKRNHLSESKNPKFNIYFYNSIRKYGEENFTWEIIEECNSIEELNRKEIECIRKYNTMRPNGYNLVIGGGSCAGIKRPEVSKRMKKNNPMKDPEISKKVGKINGIRRMGKTYDELYGEEKSVEMKENSSKRMKKNNPMKDPEIVKKVLETKRKRGLFENKQHSNDTKEKIRDGISRSWWIKYPNGKEEIIKNLSKFCRDNCLSNPTMISVSKGRRKHHRGYKCKKIGKEE